MNPLLEEIYSTILPSAPYIVLAYALGWVALFVWVLIVFNKQKKLEAQLQIFEEEFAQRSQNS